MIATLINTKVQFLLVFLSSFSIGLFFTENHTIIGNFFGSLIGAIIVRLINNIRKKPKK